MKRDEDKFVGRLTVYVPSDVKAHIDAIAQSQNLKHAGLLRQILADYLERNGSMLAERLTAPQASA